jgi:hypothetical protein
MNEPKTPNLGLNKIDRSSPSTTYFDLDKYLDQNWEKVDEGVATKEDLEELREAVSEIDVPDASLTQKGKVQLSNKTDGDREDVAATEKAVGLAFQAGAERKAEVVAALSSIGISASTSEKWEQLISKIKEVLRAVGDASPSDVRAGKSFSNSKKKDILGTLPERTTGPLTITPGVSAETRPAGIYGGDIIVHGEPNLVSSNIVLNKSIYGVSGSLVPNKVTEYTTFTKQINEASNSGTDYKYATILEVNPTKRSILTFKWYDVEKNYIAAINAGSGDQVYVQLAIQTPGQSLILPNTFQSATSMWETRKLRIGNIEVDMTTGGNITYMVNNDTYTAKLTEAKPTWVRLSLVGIKMNSSGGTPNINSRVMSRFEGLTVIEFY